MGECILIVDDDYGVRTLLEHYLRKDFEITTHSNGLEAMLWLENGNMPDLIILDMNMPEIDGQEFFQLLKGSGFFRNIPVIILSGLDVSEVSMLTSGNKYCDFLNKPFDPKVLRTKVDALLQQPEQYEISNY